MFKSLGTCLQTFHVNFVCLPAFCWHSFRAVVILSRSFSVREKWYLWERRLAGASPFSLTAARFLSIIFDWNFYIKPQEKWGISLQWFCGCVETFGLRKERAKGSFDKRETFVSILTTRLASHSLMTSFPIAPPDKREVQPPAERIDCKFPLGNTRKIETNSIYLGAPRRNGESLHLAGPNT